MGGGYRTLIAYVNHVDVHPPGSYVLNKFFYGVFGSWSLVRLVSGVLNAMSIWALWRSGDVKQLGFRAFSFFAVCLSPVLLLWGTGLRWYAYFVPLVNVLIYTLSRNHPGAVRHWGMLVLISVLLFYLNYVALILAPVVLLLSAAHRRQQLRREFPVLFIFTMAALLVCAPQLTVLVSTHLSNSASQTSGYASSVGGAVLHYFNNQGAYPDSLSGACLILANALLLLGIFSRIGKIYSGVSSQFFLVSVALMVVSRLTGKIRNLVAPAGAQGIFQTRLYVNLRNPNTRRAVFFLLAAGNLGGVINVATHTDTTKGSWNMPYDEVLAAIEAEHSGCGRMALVTYDEVLSYHARPLVDLVINVHKPGWEAAVAVFGNGCLITADTFPGSISEQDYSAFVALTGDKRTSGVRRARIGFDAHARFKRLLNKQVQDYYVILSILRKS